MSRKIVGVTVGTPTSPSKIAEDIKPISYGQQDLTEEQKAHARDNIGAVGGADVVKTTAQVLTHQQMYTARYNIDAPSTGQVVRIDQAQNLSEEQKAQARENIGVTPGGDVDVDLTDYVKNTDYATADKAGVVKVGTGLSVDTENKLQIQYADQNAIKNKMGYRNPLVPQFIDDIVKAGITTNTIPLTDAEKQAAKNWLGVTENGGTGDNPAGGGGTEKQGMELLTTITVEQDSILVDVSQCDDGTPFADKKLTRVGVFMTIKGNSAVTSDSTLSIMAGLTHPMYGSLSLSRMVSSGDRVGSAEIRSIGRMIYLHGYSNTNAQHQFGVSNIAGNGGTLPTINIIRFIESANKYPIPAGSTFEVWGC